MLTALAPRRVLAIVTGALLMAAAGCVHRYWANDVQVISLPKDGGPATQNIESAVKAHLSDGGTVIFKSGASITNGQLVGSGEGYRMLANNPTYVRASIPLDSIVGIETFDSHLILAPTIIVSTATTAVTAVATVVLLKVIFGSCPTVYADTGDGTPTLQAEGFSYAIAPLLEHRDVDPLTARPDADGTIRLELRNEALETHFINHVELLAVRHARDASVVPDQRNHLVAISDIRSLTVARDRAGRDVRDDLASADGRLFASARATVDSARTTDLTDWLDIEAKDLPPGDSVAVVLRLRNSLLNTVLLYDGILGGRDAPDFMTSGLQHISTTLDMSRWYVRTMGMHATVDGAPLAASATEHAQLGDVGPIAFRDVAITLPRATHDAKTVRVHLRFVADEWRIDRATIAGTISRPVATTIPLSRVVVPTPATGGGPRVDTAALRALAEPDDKYLQTEPGQRMTLEFAAGKTATSSDSSTTYLIAWQGWYREWIRGSWLASPVRTTPWVPGDSAMSIALGQWRTKQKELERAFYSTHIPVR